MSQSATRTRVWATQTLYQVVTKQQHLKDAMHQILPSAIDSQDRAWIQNLCYQTLRHHQNLSARWQKFIEKPIKDKLVAELLTCSLAQKFHMNTPDHAIVNEAIKAAKKLKKQWATGLVNKVLKLALQDELFSPNNDSEIYNHPQWWIDLLYKDWPGQAPHILKANNQKPPLWIRTRNQYKAPEGIPHPSLPAARRLTDTQASTSDDLKSGAFSVQDAAAQYAAYLLSPQPQEKILDACAAPGGKSCHLLELEPGIKLDILEKEKHRLAMIKDNLQRLNLTANRLILGDATQANSWFKGQKYDKILLDVPCSAAGVVRRNPDIKLLRQPEHIKQLTQLQQQILTQMAPLLKIGGHMLYATCSVFRSENERQIKKFLQQHPHFKEDPLNIAEAEGCLHGKQIITGTEHMDGFYYCMLSRTS